MSTSPWPGLLATWQGAIANGGPELSFGQGPHLPESENNTIECTFQKTTQCALPQARNASDVFGFTFK